jgi:hypothetical protein
MGDAIRFADPVHPDRGWMFDGRLAEDFKPSDVVRPDRCARESPAGGRACTGRGDAAPDREFARWSSRMWPRAAPSA